MLNIEWPIARQSSINIFLRHPVYINSGSARLVSFQIHLISEGTSRAEPEYMNIYPSPN